MLVEKMGGRIWLRSQEGQGSRFYFTLPLVVNKDRLRTQISVSGHDLTGLLQLNIDIQKTRLVGNKAAFSAYIYVEIYSFIP